MTDAVPDPLAGADVHAAARRSPSMTLAEHERQPDMKRMRAYRLARVQAELRKHDYAGGFFCDPFNVRYATGTRNMTVWTAHVPARYCFVPAQGKTILFEFRSSQHLAEGIETVGECRPFIGWYYMTTGVRQEEKAKAFAKTVAAVVDEHGGGGRKNRRVAFDRLDPLGLDLVRAEGIDVFEGEEVMQHARSVKSPDEIAGMTHALAVCDGGIARMREALQPGMTENALWALLHETNIRHGGECIETRLFASGGRTNPWFQECSDRVIRPGDLVAFDTDMIGPMGFCCDISRTFHTGPGKASAEQRKLYALAVEQIHHNLGLLKAGVSFRELTAKSYVLPEPYYPNRYANVMHGVGLADEWPVIVNRSDWDTRGYDGVLEEGMVLSVESYVGATGGVDGIKLEECALVTRDGYQLLSTFPYEERLVG